MNLNTELPHQRYLGCREFMAPDDQLENRRLAKIVGKLEKARPMRFFGCKTILVSLIMFGTFCVVHPQTVLVKDNPRPSDVIVVLSGAFYTRFPAALNLLHKGSAQRLIIDADDRHTVYGETQADRSLELAHDKDPSHMTISICRMDADSTVEEAVDLDACLKAIHAQRVLIVTSPYHTRRAIEILRHELPEYKWSVAAAQDESIASGESFGSAVQELAKLAWWNGVDRWESHFRERDTAANAAK